MQTAFCQISQKFYRKAFPSEGTHRYPPRTSKTYNYGNTWALEMIGLMMMFHCIALSNSHAFCGKISSAPDVRHFIQLVAAINPPPQMLPIHNVVGFVAAKLSTTRRGCGSWEPQVPPHFFAEWPTTCNWINLIQMHKLGQPMFCNPSSLIKLVKHCCICGSSLGAVETRQDQHPSLHKSKICEKYQICF